MTTLRANEVHNLVVSGDLEEFDSLPIASKVALISRLSDGLGMDLSNLRTALDGDTVPTSRHVYPVDPPTDSFSGRSFHIASQGN